MTTRLTDQVLARIHDEMRAGHDLHPVNNKLMAQILDRMDEITEGGYDADAAAAALFAFGSVIGSQQVTAPAGASFQDVNTFLAAIATLTGQALHAQTHVIAEAPEPVAYGEPVWRPHEPEKWRGLPHSAPQAVTFDTVPWPPDPRERIPTALVGAVATAYQLEALRQFRERRGMPPLINVIALTAMQVNQAVIWWNTRAALLDMEDPR